MEYKAVNSVIDQSKNRILFVDDNEDIRELIRILLGQAGHEVVAVSTLKEGLYRAINENFDLFLLDSRLEDGTGVELCQAIRLLYREVPILFFTGDSDEFSIRKFLDAGAQGCFIKPVDVNSLLNGISDLLQKKPTIKQN
jgi:two-component system chemotaxis response regulator CheY